MRDLSRRNTLQTRAVHQCTVSFENRLFIFMGGVDSSLQMVPNIKNIYKIYYCILCGFNLIFIYLLITNAIQYLVGHQMLSD